MKLGVFWFGSASPEVTLAIDVLARAANVFADVRLYARESAGTAFAIRDYERPYPYDAVNAIRYAYQESDACDRDFAVINFGRAVCLSPRRLHGLLASRAVGESAFAFRISRVVMRAGTSSPRLPFIDDNFIVLNVRRARAARIFDRRLINASHFAHAGGNHAVLMSLIEYAMWKGEFHNYFVQESCFDEFGRNRGLLTVPFMLCTGTGFATCYPEFDARLRRLLALNAAATGEVADDSVAAYLDAPLPRRSFAPVVRDGFHFLRGHTSLEARWKRLTKIFNDRFNYQFKKRYVRTPSAQRTIGHDSTS